MVGLMAEIQVYAEDDMIYFVLWVLNLVVKDWVATS